MLSNNEFLSSNLCWFSVSHEIQQPNRQAFYEFRHPRKRKRRQKEVREKMDHLSETLSCSGYFALQQPNTKRCLMRKALSEPFSPGIYTKFYRRIPANKHVQLLRNVSQGMCKLIRHKVFSRTSSTFPLGTQAHTSMTNPILCVLNVLNCGYESHRN